MLTLVCSCLGIIKHTSGLKLLIVMLYQAKRSSARIQSVLKLNLKLMQRLYTFIYSQKTCLTLYTRRYLSISPYLINNAIISLLATLQFPIHFFNKLICMDVNVPGLYFLKYFVIVSLLGQNAEGLALLKFYLASCPSVSLTSASASSSHGLNYEV